MIRTPFTRARDFGRRPGSRSDRSGLTLIEVVITTVLLTLVIVPIYGLLYQSRQSVAEGRYVSAARLAAEGQIERIRNIAQRSEGEFGALANYLTINNSANARFNVAGLPRWRGQSTTLYPENGGNNGRIRIALNETQQYWPNVAGGTNLNDDYFSCANFTQVPYPAYQIDLDNSMKTTGVAWTNLPVTGSYRILPIRVEVFWGPRPINGTDPGDMAPKVVLNAVISPKYKFRRG